MPIIVGTTTLKVGWYSLTARMTAMCSNIGTVTIWPATDAAPRAPAFAT